MIGSGTASSSIAEAGTVLLPTLSQSNRVVVTPSLLATTLLLHQASHSYTSMPFPRGGTRFIMYKAYPPGIDQHWMAALEVYCYLYHHTEERRRLQAQVDQDEACLLVKAKQEACTKPRLRRQKQFPELFSIRHQCARLDLRVRARQTYEIFISHLQFLLAQQGVVVSDPGPTDSVLAYPLISTK